MDAIDHSRPPEADLAPSRDRAGAVEGRDAGHDWLEVRHEARVRRSEDGPDERDAGEDQNGEDERDKGDDKRGSVLDTIRQHKLATAIIAVIVIAAIIAGLIWWLATRDWESSDDAFIDARTVAISTQVSGSIVAVPVTDNQRVVPGTVLARIDDRDYKAAVEQAQASIDEGDAAIATSTAQIAAQREQIDQASKQVTEAEAALSFAKDENKRYQDLVRQGAGTAQRAQQAASDLRQKQAALAAAQAAHAQAQKQVAVLDAQRKNAIAQRERAVAQKDQASANLSRTVLKSTVDGRVTKLTGAVGAFATPGQTLMMVVPRDMWVTANFKETQLAYMRPGQPVDIEIDAYDRSFKGHVDSIQAGSGTAFSLLPAENATGNYVKVVQRVPVKIVFDKRPDVELGPGMSVVPSVKVK